MKKAAALLLTAVIALGMCGCGRIDRNKVDDLRDEGYEIEQADSNNICIIEDGVEYYYKTGLIKPALSKIVLEVSPKSVSSEEKIVTVTITPELFRIIMIATRDSTIQIYGGREYETKEMFKFEFKHDFSWENLSTRGFHDTTSDYKWFTEDCLTPDELNEIYGRARELEKEL